MVNVPNEIYLQHESDLSDDEWPKNDEGITWCRDRINESDIRYVLAYQPSQVSELPDEIKGEMRRMRELIRKQNLQIMALRAVLPPAPSPQPQENTEDEWSRADI